MKTNKVSALLPGIVACALFLETLDATILTTSVPKIAESLNTDPLFLKYALTSYLVSLAIFIPVSGWFADRFGTKLVFGSAITIFTLASLSCGLANHLSSLVMARIIQGFGGALMMPVGRLVILKSYTKEDLFRVTNYVAIPSLIGPFLGPLVGGLISTYSHWRYIFFVNIPIGILGLILTYFFVPNYREPEPRKLDVLGFFLLASGLCISFIVLDLLAEQVLDFRYGLLLLIIAAGFLGSFVVYTKRQDKPFLSLDVFKVPSFRVTVRGSFLSRCGIGGISFLLALMLQEAHGKSPFHAGFLLSFHAVAMIIMKFLAGPIVKNFGYRMTLAANTFLLGLSTLGFATIDAQSSDSYVISLVMISGLLLSLQFTCMNVVSYVDLPQDLQSSGSSLGACIQQLSMGFGVAIGAVILRYLSYMTDQGIHDPQIYILTFIILGVYLCLISLNFLYLPKRQGL